MWSRVIAKVSGVSPWWIGDNVITVPEGQQSYPTGRRRLQEEHEAAVLDTTDPNPREKKEVAPRMESENDAPKGNAVDDDESEENFQEPSPEENSGEGEEGEFVADAVAQEEIIADEEKRGDSSDVVREENSPSDDDSKKESDEQESQHRDYSSFDTWMGILSSSRIKYFVRIVPS